MFRQIIYKHSKQFENINIAFVIFIYLNLYFKVKISIFVQSNFQVFLKLSHYHPLKGILSI